MKFPRFFATILLLISCFATSAFATSETDKISWFFKTSEESSRPCFPTIGEIAKEHGAIFIGSEGDKKIYLTFDAGYSNENVEKTLDILKDQNVKAAFFILPGIIKNSPETVKRMAEEGHLVCNHTWSHCDMSKLTESEDVREELTKLEALYKASFGSEMEKFVRPPEGSFSERSLELSKQLGYTTVFWSFAYADWDNSKQQAPEKAMARVLNSAHDGMVMLLHPTSKTNADILSDVIVGLREKGFEFGTLDELKAKADN